MTALEEVAAGVATGNINEIRLVGRLAAPAVLRGLPSGDEVMTFRVIVDRGQSAAKSRQRVDTIDCSAWTGRLRRSVAGWREGDVVEVQGALRRRFFRGGGAVASRVEVEVSAAKVIRRAASG